MFCSYVRSQVRCIIVTRLAFFVGAFQSNLAAKEGWFRLRREARWGVVVLEREVMGCYCWTLIEAAASIVYFQVEGGRENDAYGLLRGEYSRSIASNN